MKPSNFATVKPLIGAVWRAIGRTQPVLLTPWWARPQWLK